MSRLAKLYSFVEDPPPGYAFEISSGGIASARLNGGAPEIKFEALPAGTVEISPVKDNVADAAALEAAVGALAGVGSAKKRRAALVLPDFCARVAVIDFDTLPSGAEEQRALVRFRMRKSVPFDLDGAALSYHTQPGAGPDAKIQVVVAVLAAEIVARYEAPFRTAGFHPGLVTTSTLASLNLLNPEGITVLAKLSGAALSVAVLDERTVRLVRCVELEKVETAEAEAVLLPTLAFVEDELGRPARRVVLCGFGAMAEGWSASWGLPVEALRSRFGAPGGQNAGLLGLVESLAA